MRAQVVVLDGRKILMSRHARDGREYWVLPGGAVERGETPKMAAVREMREESGLEVQLGRLLFVENSQAGPVPITSPRYTYLADRVAGEFAPVAEGTMVGMEWLPLDWTGYDAATQRTLQRVREALAQGTAKRRGAQPRKETGRPD